MPANLDLLTLFIAVTALAVIVQTAVVTGLCIATLKMARQADRAIAETQRLFGPIQQIVTTLETASSKLGNFTVSARKHSKI